MRKAAITTTIAKTMSHPIDMKTPPAVISVLPPYFTGKGTDTREGDRRVALHENARTRAVQNPNGLQAPLGVLVALLSWVLRPTWANRSLAPVTSPTVPVAVAYS